MDWLLSMLAQVDPSAPIPSSYLQYGAFGLLCYIVAFLYPSETQKGREAAEKRDKMMVDLLEKAQASAEGRNDKIVIALSQQTTELKNEATKHVAGLLEALDHVCQANGQGPKQITMLRECDKPESSQHRST